MKKECKLGILQALLITFYCSLVGLVMWRGNEIFGKVDSYIGPVTVLVMLSVSALICGLIVFYKPYKLFFANKREEAINVVVYTAVSLLIILFILFALMTFIK
jgi:hypothetical protein